MESSKPAFGHQRTQKQTENFKSSKNPHPLSPQFPPTNPPINTNKQRETTKTQKDSMIHTETHQATLG